MCDWQLTVLNDALTLTILTIESFKIGGEPTQPLYFEGFINSVRGWNIELDSANVLAEYNGGIPLFTPIQTSRVIINTGFNSSIWDGSNWQIPDLSGITSGYSSVNMEQGDRQTDCPT